MEPVTVYVVVVAGEAVAVLTPVEVAPADQVNEVAVLAVSVAPCPAQIVGEFTVTTGNGLTVIVYVTSVPTQPLRVGVIVIVDVIADAVALVAVNAGLLPAPFAAKPIAVLEFVQAKVAPVGELTKASAGTTAAGHTVTFAGAVIVGIGLTKTLPEPVLVQPAAV